MSPQSTAMPSDPLLGSAESRPSNHAADFSSESTTARKQWARHSSTRDPHAHTLACPSPAHHSPRPDLQSSSVSSSREAVQSPKTFSDKLLDLGEVALHGAGGGRAHEVGVALRRVRES